MSFKLTGQRKALLEALRHGKMNTGEIRGALGIGMPATRVWELKKMGYDIRTEMVEVTCRLGQTAQVAEYTLYESIPIQQAA